MKVSQYNHLCQVFGTTLYAYGNVFNSKNSFDARLFVNLLSFIKLPYMLIVDILVDKHRFLLQAITLR